MKRINLLSLLFASLTFFIGCDDFEDVNTNPNVTTHGNSAMLATRLLQDMAGIDGNGNNKNFIRDELLGKYLSWTEAQDIDLAFNLLSRASFDNISSLRNVRKMIDAATQEGQKYSYEGFGHFVRAFMFFNVTMRVGDIPYSDAVKGEEEIYFPKYDSQKDVILGILKELDEADALFAKGQTFDGDYIYNGDCVKWRKAVNVLQLKILINLYKKTGDADLKVAERFNTILNSRPIFESVDDNFQIVFSNKANQKYPMNLDINSFSEYELMTTVLVDKLKELEDYRLFSYASPTPESVKNGKPESDWDSYNGVDPILPEADIQRTASTGTISQLNTRYEQLADCEPVFLLSYQEMNFILAEAAARGIISKNAKDYYNEGIRSSMKFTATYTPDTYNHGRKMTDEYIESYISSSKVAFAGNLDTQIKQIIWQKYITTFMQTPYNAFFEYRRTGVPEFKINTLSNRNIPSDKMPMRWMYPSNELNYNMDNVSEAISRQYGGSDDYMGVMWILQ